MRECLCTVLWLVCVTAVAPTPVLRVPFTATVALWGLPQRGFEPGAVEESLAAQLPRRVPKCGLRDMRVEYVLRYQATRLPEIGLRRVESLLARSLRQDAGGSVAVRGDNTAFIELCPAFVEEFSREVAKALPDSEEKDDEQQQQHGERHTILLLRPRKANMRPLFIPAEVDDSDWRYEYRPCGGGDATFSAQWIGRGRVVISDLSALSSLAPTPAQQQHDTLLLRTDVEARAQQAVRKVLLPDMAWCSGIGERAAVDVHSKIIAPIVVFKDFGVVEHSKGIARSLHRWVRPSLLRKSLRVFLDPDQHLFVGASVYALLDRGQVATTFFDAIQTETTFSEEDSDDNGKNDKSGRRQSKSDRHVFDAKHRSFVDGDMLLDRMLDFQDGLTLDIIHRQFIGLGEQDEASRTVPVYVFVVNSGSALAFRSGGRVHITPNAVAVLHDSSERLSALHERLASALATSLFGVLGPWAAVEGRFGSETLYSSTAVLSSGPVVAAGALASQCLIDAALRNIVLSRADAALTIIVDAARTLDHFVNARLGGVESHATFSPALNTWNMPSSEKAAPLEPRPTRSSVAETVAYLRSRLARMDEDIFNVSSRLGSGKVLASHKHATRLFERAKRLSAEIASETSKAEATLACCSVRYAFEDDDAVRRGGKWRTRVLGGVLFGAMVAAVGYWLRAAMAGGDGEDRSHHS